MTIYQYHLALTEIENYTDRDAFVSDLALSSAFPEESDLTETVSELSMIWESYHMTIRDLRTASGLSRMDFSRRFCIPIRTIENWECTGPNARECPVYVRLLIAEAIGMMPEVTP